MNRREHYDQCKYEFIAPWNWKKRKKNMRDIKIKNIYFIKSMLSFFNNYFKIQNYKISE